jgi:hypothetical protein
MTNLCEPLIVKETEGSESAREVLILSLRSLIEKLKIIADYYLPSLIGQLEKPKKDALPASPQKDIQGEQTATEQKDQPAEDLNKTVPSNADIASIQWQDQSQTISLNDCRNMIRFIFQPVKAIAMQLGKCHLSESKSFKLD